MFGNSADNHYFDVGDKGYKLTELSCRGGEGGGVGGNNRAKSTGHERVPFLGQSRRVLRRGARWPNVSFGDEKDYLVGA